MHKSLPIYIALTLLSVGIISTITGVVGYRMGLQEGQSLQVPTTAVPSPATTVACPEDAYLCPDGTQVGRVGPNCEFAACPSPEPVPTTAIGTPEEVFCTQEAKQCPDGSFVGRTGPNCEFAACP